jgi:hypothetical protein
MPRFEISRKQIKTEGRRPFNSGGGLPAALIVFSLIFLDGSGQVQAVYVQDLIRYDGSVNSVVFQVRAGVWGWDNNQGKYVLIPSPLFSHRLPHEVFLAVFNAVSVNGVMDFEGELTGYLGIHLKSGQTHWGRGWQGFFQRIAARYSFDGIGGRDPFEKVLGDVALSIFVDRHKDFPAGNTRLEEYVEAATNGEAFASLGFGPAIDRALGGAPGEAISEASWTIHEPNLLRLSAGLNLAAVRPSLEFYPFPGLPNPVNGDINSARLQITFLPAEGGSWPWQGAALLEFRIVPEPGSLPLVAGFTASGIAGLFWRKGRRLWGAG